MQALPALAGDVQRSSKLLLPSQQPLAMSMGSLEADKSVVRHALLPSGGSGGSLKTHKKGEAKVHMVGSVPDMSASWSAKVAVTTEQQADALAMAQVYGSMREKFAAHGLNLAAVRATRQYYANLDGPNATPHPLQYAHFPTPLEDGAVRLGVFLLGSAPSLAARAVEATQEVFSALPEGMQPHASGQTDLHLTIFMPSQPSDPRPDPFAPDGGLDPKSAPHPIPAPTAETLTQEVQVFRDLAATTRPPRFEVHSLVFADSGTLLLCFVDTSKRLAGLRAQLRIAFTGGAARQSSIMHITLGRVLAPKQLTADDIAAVQAKCDTWTAKLRGTAFTPDALWHVQELTFTSVDGKRERLALNQD
ncbi:hypothetical protein WJX72_002341 [[Myrmecia] bisecta]|uniref:Uncharacterized protein n=1 Tax=[Myrmecia] bisecta TaxID=41462 RepID=A0AAW1PRU3_9CHLO